MNFRSKNGARLPEVQFTSLIDVVFLLLCFFITTSVFSQWEYEVDIVLPTAQSGKMPDRLPGEVIINLTREGDIILNQQKLTTLQLKERLVRLARFFPGQPVVLRADNQTVYENVMGVIDICRQADIWNISFATRGDGRMPPPKAHDGCGPVRGILQVFHGRNRLPAALALLLTLPVGGLTAAPAAPDATAKTDAIEVEDRKLLADGLFSRGFHELALPEYLALSTRQPPPAALDEVLFRLGECQRQLKRLPDAEASFRRLTLELPQSPLHDRAVLMRGLIVVEMGNPSVGAALLESLLKSATNADLRASATYHAGEAHEKAGDAARAEAHFRTLREKAPAHELAAYAGLRLAALQARGDDPKALDAAMALYQQLADKPFNARVGAEALFQAASLAYARGQFETSARLFRQLAERYPEDQRTAEAARPSAWAHFRIDRFADALKSATAGAALEGQLTDALAEWLYLRANCERRLDRHAEALKSYEALLALEPAPAYAPAARYERLLVLFKEGAYEQVLKEADAIVNPPTDYVADLYWIPAAAAEALKDSARAIQFYGLLIRDAPDSPLTIDAVYRLAYHSSSRSRSRGLRAYLVLAERCPPTTFAPQAPPPAFASRRPDSPMAPCATGTSC